MDFRARMLGTLGEEGLVEFWRHARGQDWFDAHAQRAGTEESPATYIPVRLHGDDAPLNARSSIMILSWPSTQCRLRTWLSRFDASRCLPVKSTSTNSEFSGVRITARIMDHNADCGLQRVADLKRIAGLGIIVGPIVDGVGHFFALILNLTTILGVVGVRGPGG